MKVVASGQKRLPLQPPTIRAPAAMRTKERPRRKQPIAILATEEGSVRRDDWRAKRSARSGVKRKITNGLKDWYQGLGICRPKRVGQTVCSSAQSCIVFPCC